MGNVPVLVLSIELVWYSIGTRYSISIRCGGTRIAALVLIEATGGLEVVGIIFPV